MRPPTCEVKTPSLSALVGGCAGDQRSVLLGLLSTKPCCEFRIAALRRQADRRIGRPKSPIIPPPLHNLKEKPVGKGHGVQLEVLSLIVCVKQDVGLL